MNIIEKLGTPEEIKQYNMYQFPGEMIEEPNGEYVTYDDYVKLKKQRDELLEALIEQSIDMEDRWDMNSPNTNPGIKDCYAHNIHVIEKTRYLLKWKKIKELSND